MKKIYLTLSAALFAVASFAQTSAGANTLPVFAAYHALAKEPAAPTDTAVIRTQPEGTVHANLYRVSKGYYYAGGSAYQKASEGYVAKYVEGKDGAFYLELPFSTLKTGWLKGQKDADGVVKFTLPQPILSVPGTDENGKEKTTHLYAWRMVLKEATDNQGHTGKTYVPDANQSLIYQLNGTSLTKIDNALLGVGNDKGIWTGFGEISTVEYVNKDPLVTPPADAEDEATDFALNFNEVTKLTASGKKVLSSTIVKGYADSKNFYFKGISQDAPEAWIKGELNGDKVVFKKQYLGIDKTGRYHAYFIPTYVESTFNPLLGYSMLKTIGETDSVAFSYDAVTNSLKSDSCFYFNIGKHNPESDENYVTGYYQPSIVPFEEVAATPGDPVFTNFDQWDYNDSYGEGYVRFDLPYTDDKGNVLNTNKLFYNVYINGQLTSFAPDAFNYLEKPLTDIPYYFEDKHTFQTYGKEHNIYFYMKDELHTIGVQLVYTGGNTTNKSKLVVYDVDSHNSIQNVYSADELLHATTLVYHDLSGRAVKNPAKGLYLKTVKLTDGTLKTFKVMIK